MTVSRHCKRARRTTDTNSTLTRLHAADINIALHMLRADPLYFDNKEDTTTTTTTSSNVVSLAQVAEPSVEEWVPPPVDVAVQHHWLAVDGVAVDAPVPAPNHSNSAGDGGVQTDALLLAGLLSPELQLLYTRVTTMASGDDHNSDDDDDDSVAATQSTLLHTLASTQGLQELLPFLLQFAQQQLYRSWAAHAHSSTTTTTTTLALLHALLHNPHVHWELYLHQLVPLLVTAVQHDPAAAPLLLGLVRSYQHQYATLRTRVTAVLSRHERSIGALRVVTALGQPVPASVLRCEKDHESDPHWQQAVLTALASQEQLQPATRSVEETLLGDALVATGRVLSDYHWCWV